MTRIVFILVAIALSLFGYNSQAQSTKDAVYLKNGSIIRGVIIEQKSGEFIKIETACTSVWVFSMSEVERIETNTDDRWSETAIDKYQAWSFSPAFQLLLASDDIPYVSLNAGVNHQFHNQMAVGVGTGLEYIDFTLYPLYGRFDYYLRNRPFSPYISLIGGYAFSASSNNNDWQTVEGGLLAGAELVMATRMGQNAAFEFKIGYRRQHAVKITENFNWNNYEEINYYYFNRLSLGIGFRFY